MQRSFPETFDQLKIASPLKRLGAMVYDFMLIVALWMLIGAIAVAFNDGEAVEGALFNTVLFLATFSFFAFFWTRNGQTLGMMAWRLRVQTLEGGPISLTQALIRFLVAAVSFGCAGLGYLWMFISQDKMTWHDQLSKTHMVELPKPAKK
ncbi:MAG: RDD family protein [Pontibacterium sp.]